MGGSGWGVRVDVNERSFCENSKKKFRGGGGRWGGRGVGLGGQSGCERRIEIFLKIQKKRFVGGGVGGGGSGEGSGWM